ncbi:hypothetical protein HDU91_002713, partial [Kappamyces sp. JEL0680]
MPDLSPELWQKIFAYLDSPRQVYKVLPLVSRHFYASSRQACCPLLVNVEILCDDPRDDPSFTMIQFPESIKILPGFAPVAVQERMQSATPLSRWQSATSMASDRTLDEDLHPDGRRHATLRDAAKTASDLPVLKVGLTRQIRIHSNAITDRPEHLVAYIGLVALLTLVEQLLRKGIKRKFRIVFGGVDIQGNHTPDTCATLSGFLGFLRPQNISIWSWDTQLIQDIGKG